MARCKAYLHAGGAWQETTGLIIIVEGCLQDDEEESGDGDPQKAFEEYCAEVENSAAWGGQLELGALAKVLQRHIAVYSAGMPPVNMGLDFKGTHRHTLAQSDTTCISTIP